MRSVQRSRDDPAGEPSLLQAGGAAQETLVRRGSPDPAETDDRRSALLVFFLYNLAAVHAMNIRRPIADGYLDAGA